MKKPKQNRKPTALQKKLAAILAAEPDIALAAALRKCGYSPITAHHHASQIVNAPGTQSALVDCKVRVRDKAQAHVDQALKTIVAVMDGGNDHARLLAADRILLHAGIADSQDRQQLMVVCFQAIIAEVAPVLKLMPPNLIPKAATMLKEISDRCQADCR